MKKPDHIALSDFIYDLPDERIARYPLPQRDQSRLLVYRKGEISETVFHGLPAMLDRRHILVFNDTRVIHARLRFRKSSGAAIEIFLLEPVEPSEHQLSFTSRGKTTWRCLVGNARKWNNGESLIMELNTGGEITCFKAENDGRAGDTFRIKFSWTPGERSFSEILEAAGETPIPPYLKRPAEPADAQTYQTIYSLNEGSVAAPTAGLHFTEEVIRKTARRGIDRLYLTLHVGAGTFTPVKNENAAGHPMHTEHFRVSAEVLGRLAGTDREIIATGTTSCRTLESLYWLGVKALKGSAGKDGLHLSQWEAWDLPGDVPVRDALNALYEMAVEKNTATLQASTAIMITPGYSFKMISGLITNFHQPASTLLMLIAAFTGEDWKRIYKYALDHDFRFLSYGDSSLLLP